MSIDEKVDRVLGWLDLPPNLSPRLLTMYIGDVDTAGHNGGAFSTGVRSALEHVDLGMKKLVGGIAERGLTDKVNLVVVSDHGMTNCK